MHHVHPFKKFLTVALLSVSAMACSSPEQDAEVREEPAKATDAQDVIEREAIDNTTNANSEDGQQSSLVTDNQTTDSQIIDEHDMDDHDMDEHDMDDDLDTEDSNSKASNGTNGMSSEVQQAEAIDNKQIGTHDNKDIADGTDIEEHVSTY